MVKDTIDPTVAITSAPSINDANEAAYVVEGSCSENGEDVVVKVGPGASPSVTVVCNTLGAPQWTATLDTSLEVDVNGIEVTFKNNNDTIEIPVTWKKGTAATIKIQF